MAEHRYCARITVAAVGRIGTGLDTHHSSDPEGGSWLSVRTGLVLTYCEHSADVTGRAAAWHDALRTAARDAAHRDRPTPAGPERVIAQITAQPGDTWDITGYTATAAPDGVAVLYVRTGALTVRCYDQTAVHAIEQIWRDAAAAARPLWHRRTNLRTP